MAVVARLCLFTILLTFTVTCFGRDMPKGNQNRVYDIEDYGETGPNPKHDPKSPPPPPPPRGHLKMQINMDDYGGTGPNPGHDPQPPPPTSNLDVLFTKHPKMQIDGDEDDYVEPGPNPGHDHPPPA